MEGLSPVEAEYLHLRVEEAALCEVLDIVKSMR